MAEPLPEPSVEAADPGEQPTPLAAEEGPSVESIRIYLRSRPVQEPSELVEYDQDERQLTLRVPKDATSGCARWCRCRQGARPHVL